ncbi:unnamed protein product, partial [marine sediment metagenome]
YIKWIEQEKKEEGFTKNDVECFKKIKGLSKDGG